MKKADRLSLSARNWKRLNDLRGTDARRGQGRVIALLVALVIAVSIAAVINGQGLRQAVVNRTRDYVGDVSFQLAQDIDNRLVKIARDLEMLSDTVMQMGVQTILP